MLFGIYNLWLSSLFKTSDVTWNWVVLKTGITYTTVVCVLYRVFPKSKLVSIAGAITSRGWCDQMLSGQYLFCW